MRVVRGHAWHAMPEQGLSRFIINTKASEVGREGMPEIVKMQVLDLRQAAHASPVFLEGAHIIPTVKHSAVRQRRQGIM